MKLKLITLSLLGVVALSACNNTGNSTQSTGVTTESNTLEKLSSKNAIDTTIDVTDLNPQDWQKDWQDQISTLSTADQQRLREVGYYVKAAKISIDNVYPGSNNNPDNVKRIERLMPKDNFERTFPLLTSQNKVNGFYPAQTYSYTNFLRAAAVVPAYCGDFSDYPGEKTAEMANPDNICKRMLATTFAHAVQETADMSSIGLTNINDKIARTFASVAEANATPEARGAVERYFDATGPFATNGAHYAQIQNNYYYGRGAKQLSYPSNYANLSLMIYGNLLLLENPDLVQGDNILPYLSSIVYAIQPKNGRPSIAEVMDGSFKKYAQGNAATYAKMGFPFTVALVNGGPECKGQNHENTQTRIRAFRYFSESGKLFTSGFGLTPAEETATNCDNVDYADASIYAASQRYYYFDSSCKLVKWDSGNPVFGGSGYRDIMCNAAPTPTPEDKPTPPPTPAKTDYNGYKITVINDSMQMGIDKLHIRDLRGRDEGFDLAYVKEKASAIFPDITPWNADLLANYTNHSVVISYSPTWEQDSDTAHTYNCYPFDLTENVTVVIHPSSKSSDNQCYTYPSDDE